MKLDFDKNAYLKVMLYIYIYYNYSELNVRYIL